MRTDLGDTRERASLLRFEPSGSLAATNVQDAIVEAAASGGGLSPLTTPSVKTVTGAIAVTDVVVQVNHAGAITLTLPLSTGWAAQNSEYGLPLSIFDITGAASSNNVTIDCTGGELIDGMASIPIAADYGGYRLMPKSGGGWVVV